MDGGTFAAQRRQSLTDADERLEPAVKAGLGKYASGEDGWDSGIIDAAAQIWLENFQAENPGGSYANAERRFRTSLAAALEKTGQPDGGVGQTQVDRITRWLSTYAINAGTMTGSYGRGIRSKVWRTMEDSKVREIHRDVDGKVVPIGSTWDVAGTKVPYPGAPVGPPEVWIECRCVAQPASREGEAMSANTFTITDDDGAFAAQNVNPDGTPYTGALVVLVPADDDPVTAASSEPAHLTFVWFGDLAEMQSRDTAENPQVDMDTLQQEVRQWAADQPGPITVPVASRGTLGDDNADVAFLHPTPELLAARDQLLSNEQVGSAHGAVKQFPEYTPHVTLGYPERPAASEYDEPSVTFDRASLWLGGEHHDYPMGGDAVTASAAAPTTEAPPVDTEDNLVPDEPDDGEEIVTEVPIHGVLAVEDVETGDGRGFRPGALSTRPLPIPYRYEAVGSHGGNQTSEVYDVGRIDNAWMQDGQMRFTGAIVLSLPYAAEAINSILSGVKTGLSIDADQMSDDVETYTEEYIDAATSQGKNPTRWFKTTRVSGATQVPIPAFAESYTGLGHEFEEDMSPEDKQAAVDALTACGCLEEVDEEAYQAAIAADPSLAVPFRDVSTQERKDLADAGAAMPDGSYPIKTVDDLKNAIQAIGRASDPAAVKKHIKKRAAALGQSALIPADWTTQGDSFATGGVITPSDRLALVGADGPETIVPLAAFAPGTHDGPGWITHPVPTARIRRYWTHGKGAAKIRWGEGGDFNRCRAQLAKYVQNPEWLAGMCANMHKEALGFWPSTHAKAVRQALTAAGGLPSPIATLRTEASERREYPAEWFADPRFTGVTPMHIDKQTGRISGHLAQWNSCHIGVNGACTKPPKSGSHYANFLHGVVDTDQGEQSVGTLTYGIGHANPMLRAAAATAHYDQTDAVFAFVNIGEDRFGIWYSGVLRPGVTEEMIDDVRAIGSLSGDWRRFPKFGLDLVAAVSVNTPGYSLAASAAPAWEGNGDLQMSALGLGLVDPANEHDGETHEQFVSRVAVQVVAKLRRDERRQALAARVHTLRVQDMSGRVLRLIESERND
jgi:hypothetical protein